MSKTEVAVGEILGCESKIGGINFGKPRMGKLPSVLAYRSDVANCMNSIAKIGAVPDVTLKKLKAMLLALWISVWIGRGIDLRTDKDLNELRAFFSV